MREGGVRGGDGDGRGSEVRGGVGERWMVRREG